MNDLLTTSGAVISRCGKYRYRLERFWSGEHALPFIMLNPSTADASNDDPTIRRCMGFARERGFGGIIVANLFAYRATSPADMKAEAFPVGALNDATITDLMRWAKRAGVPVVAAWGTHGVFRRRDEQAISFARLMGCNLVSLGTTKNGHPKHPLYVKADQPFEPYPAQGIEARSDETAKPVPPEGREPDGEADAPNPANQPPPTRE